MLAVILLLILDYARGKIWTESNRNPDRPGAVKRELAQRIADFFEAFDPYGFRDEYIGEPERAILDTLDLLESDPEELAAQIAEAILELEETEEKELVEESRKLAQEIGRPLEYRGATIKETAAGYVVEYQGEGYAFSTAAQSEIFVDDMREE